MDIKHMFKKEKELLYNSRKLKYRDDLAVLIGLSLLTCVLFILLSIYRMLMHNATISILYIIVACICLIIHILSHVVCKKHMKAVMPCLYILSLTYFSLAIFTSSIMTPNYPAVAFIGFILIFPITITDRSVRINSFIILFLLLHILFSYIYKDTALFVNDVTTGMVFSFVAIFLGRIIRKTKLNNYESNRQLAIQSSTDELTGLGNRRKLYDVVNDNVSGITPTGVIMMDIDWFKVYNDTYGHVAGDKCLNALGSCLLDFSLRNDIDFFRYGGEEILALDTLRSYAELEKTAEALLDAVRTLNIPFKDSEFGILTVSCGVSYSQDGIEGFEKLVSKADEALYYSKKHGRNRCTAFSFR